MKRTLSFGSVRQTALVVAGMGLIAGTYGLVRLAYGLFLPDIQASLGLGSALAGYVASAASAAYCVGALLAAGAGERPRRLVLAALVTALVGSTGMAAAGGLAVFVPSAVLSSVGAGLASPALVEVVQRNVAAPGRDRAQAVVNAGTGPGLVAAGALALLLPDWRLGLLLGGLSTAAAGVAVLLLDDHDDDGGDAGAAPVRAPQARPRWRLLLVPALAAVLLGTASAVVWTYGRTHLVVAGASDSASVLAWIGLGAGGAATVLTARRLAGLDPARAWALTAAAVAVSTATLGLGAGRLPVAVLACVVFGWGFVAASSALIVWTARLMPASAAAGTSALFVMLVVGQAVGAAAAGGIGQRHGFEAAFVAAALVAALAAACGARRVTGPG